MKLKFFFFKKKFKIFGYLQIPLISSSRRTILLFSLEVAVLLLLAVVSTLGRLLCISLVEISFLIFSRNLFCSDIVVNNEKVYYYVGGDNIYNRVWLK